MRPESQPVVEL